MGQTIIVTGGLGALGRAVVAELSGRGHNVVVVDVAPAPADAAGALTLGGVDLTDEAAVEAAYAKAAEKFGGVDGLVNIAGGFIWETVIGGKAASFDDMYRINLKTAVVSSRAALPHLLKTGGAIVNIGAFGAVRPGTGFASYAASKAGVHALTESLAEELRGKNVRVNAVLPTIIDTPTNRKDMPDADFGTWVQPAAIADVILFLASPAARAITGALIPVSRGG